MNTNLEQGGSICAFCSVMEGSCTVVYGSGGAWACEMCARRVVKERNGDATIYYDEDLED
jgi:hypothetical protein